MSTTGLTAIQRAALRDLLHHWSNRRLVLIGASALGCHLEMEWRKTNDLDLVIAAEMDELCFPSANAAKLESRTGWSRDPRLEHRWRFRGLPIDIVPAGSSALSEGSITWPASGIEMSISVMDLALAHTVKVAVGDGYSVDVAKVAAIMMLKMASFCDRPYDRERDLEDINHILCRYLDGDDRCFHDSVLDSGVDFNDVNAFLCGQDIAAILSTQTHEEQLEGFLSLIEEESPHFFRMVYLSPMLDEEQLAAKLQAFRLGLER